MSEPETEIGAPSFHQHTHDVAVIGHWMEDLNTDPLEIRKADLVAEALVDFVVSKSAQYNGFFNELVRQAAVHCPKIASLLSKVWIGTFALLDRSTVAYERQLRASQKLRAKMIRLLEHTRTKLENYKQELDDTKEMYDEKDAECVDLKVLVAGLRRELTSLQIENDRLKARIAQSMRQGTGDDDEGEEHSIEWLSTQFDIQFDKIDTERRRKLKYVHDQDRLVKHFEMSLLLKEKNKKRIIKVHKEVQTEEEEKETADDIPPPAAPKKKVKGSHIPPEFREHMNSFPKKVRVMSLRGLRRIILQMYLEKTENDQSHDDANHARVDMEAFVSEFIYHKYGLHTLADYHLTELIQSVRHYHKEDSRVRMFDLFTGCKNGRAETETSILGPPAVNFMVDTFRQLRDAKEVTKEGIMADPNAYVEVRRQKAQAIARKMFDYMALPLVSRVVARIEALPDPLSKDHRKVSLDDFMSLMLIEWALERQRWEARLKPLFDKYSAVPRRGSGSGEDGGSASGSASTTPRAADPAVESTSITPEMWNAIVGACSVPPPPPEPKEKEPITAKMARNFAQMTKGRFIEAMHEVEPDLFEEKVVSIFEEARTRLEIAKWDKQRKPWKEAKDKETGRKYFYNERTQETAWKMPDLKKEVVDGLDHITFIEMAYDNGVLKSTIDENAVLDIETKAAVFIQRNFRRYLDRIYAKRAPDAEITVKRKGDGKAGGAGSAAA